MIKKTLLPLFLLSLLQADTVEFNNGALLKGKVTKQDKTTLTIKVAEETTTYAKTDIKNITLDVVISPPPAVSKPPAPTKNRSITIESGTQIHAVVLTSINSQEHKQGDQFKMHLENDIVAKNGKVIAKKGSDIYGTIVQSVQARRLIGESKIIITLNAININNRRIAIKTDAINILAPKKQGRDSVGKVARAAVIGGLINGNDGAKDGAKVGLGLAVLTRGKPTGVQSGTLLDFTLTSDFVVELLN